MGAATGCNIDSCERSYHFPCFNKAEVDILANKYAIYCRYHSKTIFEADK